ncbi:MAG: hypothetical protein ACWGQW_01380 [bacterium]
MSKQASVNNGPGINGAASIFILKTVLKAAGWTVPRSSDGITYNSSGDQITHNGSGAGGMSNDNAWFVIESPNGEHQWCFQVTTNRADWRVKISPLDGFVGGSPNAVTTPSATDEAIIAGGGTDASPSFAQVLPDGTTHRYHVIAEDVAVGSAVPIYPFWAFATSGAGSPESLIMQEAMDPNTFPELSSGTRAAPVIGDPDPCIYCCKFGGDGFLYANAGWNNLAAVYGWYRYNYAEEAYTPFDGYYMQGESSQYQGAPHNDSDGWGQDPTDGSDNGLPILVGRQAGQSEAGMKGFCNHLRGRTVDREYPNTINLSTDAMVYARNLLIPWPNNIVPLV